MNRSDSRSRIGDVAFVLFALAVSGTLAWMTFSHTPRTIEVVLTVLASVGSAVMCVDRFWLKRRKATGSAADAPRG
jgi:hypothetical protein